jgi:hypothetical protein
MILLGQSKLQAAKTELSLPGVYAYLRQGDTRQEQDASAISPAPSQPTAGPPRKRALTSVLVNKRVGKQA